MISDNKVTYHEVDFLLPAQRFNIQFSYVSQKGLPFIREFVLRLVHVASMSKAQIATYFGLTHRETEEAISDLVQRGELTLSSDGRLALTDKSNGYFSEVGEIPHLSTIQDSGCTLSFDLATFSCFSNQAFQDHWRGGVTLKVDDNNISQSEKLVEKHFQYQFNQILDKGYLSHLQVQVGKEQPSIYTVNSVNKLRQIPLRLTTEFKMDSDGKAVEREDYEQLNSSECVHELMAVEIARLSRHNNTMSIFKALNQRIRDKTDYGGSPFIWVAPSDPYWSKSIRFISSLSNFLSKSATKDKQLYKPVLYVPVRDAADARVARQWKYELGQFHEYAKGLVEGLLDGNVEILHLEDELSAVIYHISQPEILPVTMPLGFITTNKETVKIIGTLVTEYIKGTTGFDKFHDCGAISAMIKKG